MTSSNLTKTDVVYLYGTDLPGYNKTKEACIEKIKSHMEKGGGKKYVVFECRPICVVELKEVIEAVETELKNKVENIDELPKLPGEDGRLDQFPLKDDLPF